jgi:2-haloacid dehalogenase/putative hydrolase of the HAD superfamily
MTATAFDLITFDCYGTLIDWEGGIVRAFQEEAGKDGLKLDPDDIIAAYMKEEPVVEGGPYKSYSDVLTETAGRVASRLGWGIRPERAGFLASSIGDWQPFPDTNAALERLSRRYTLGILSNTDDDLLAQTRRHFTVDFGLIVTAQQVRSYKPAPAHFVEALGRAGGRRLLHAAQSYFHDIVPTAAMGIPSAWVKRKSEDTAHLDSRPTYVVRDLTGLADLMSSESS